MGCGQLTNSTKDFWFFFCSRKGGIVRNRFNSPASFKQAKYSADQSIVNFKFSFNERIHSQCLIVEPYQNFTSSRSCFVMGELLLRCLSVFGIVIQRKALPRKSGRSL